MLLTSSIKLLRMFKLLLFPLVFQERSESYSTSANPWFIDCFQFQPGVSSFCLASFLALTSNISADDPWWSIQCKILFFLPSKGHLLKFLDQCIHCPRPRSSCCPSCPNCTHPCHFQPCQLNRSHCRCYSPESWRLWCPTPIWYHHSRRCPCNSLLGWYRWSFPRWYPSDRRWWTQWCHYRPSSLTMLLRQSYHWREIRAACAPHSVWWWWSRESQGRCWKCNFVYGLRWC